MRGRKEKPLDVRQVEPGDEVIIRHRDNWLAGEVKYTDGLWYIEAFKIKIPFAKDGKHGLGARMVPGVDLRGHTAQLINEETGS